MTLISPIISPALVPSNLPHADPSNSSLLAKEPQVNAVTETRSGPTSGSPPHYEAEALAFPLAPAGRFPNEGDLFSMLFDLDGNNAISLDDFAQPSEAEAKELMKLYEGSELSGDGSDLIEYKA
ncbi:MAG: hypothetical protein ACSHXY_11500 [Alphaproteobacteria bacterium]